jgi:hypothetical protein
VMFHVGEDEILLDDSRRFANRIEAAGGVAHRSCNQSVGRHGTIPVDKRSRQLAVKPAARTSDCCP